MVDFLQAQNPDAIDRQGSKDVLIQELQAGITTHFTSGLSEYITGILHQFSVPIPQYKSGERVGTPLPLGKTFLVGLNTERPTTEIARLTDTPFILYALNNKAEMEKESAALGHCV